MPEYFLGSLRAVSIGEVRQDWPQDFLGIEWGWAPKSKPNPESHELLTKAQQVLGTRALGRVYAETDFTLNLLRVAVDQFRPLFILNLSDMFYYVSTQGKNAVRLTFAQQLVKYQEKELIEDNPLISLTMIGHSAGSVIAFDTLFYLFYPHRTRPEYLDPSLAPEARAATERAGGPGVEKILSDLQKLRELAQKKHLRIRRLITLGSLRSLRSAGHAMN